MTNSADEYGVVANVVEPDSAFRLGAKAWMRQWHSGGERAEWAAVSRGGRPITKVAPVTRFGNFRCKWIPEHLREHILSEVQRRGWKSGPCFGRRGLMRLEVLTRTGNFSCPSDLR